MPVMGKLWLIVADLKLEMDSTTKIYLPGGPDV